MFCRIVRTQISFLPTLLFPVSPISFVVSLVAEWYKPTLLGFNLSLLVAGLLDTKENVEVKCWASVLLGPFLIPSLALQTLP